MIRFVGSIFDVILTIVLNGIRLKVGDLGNRLLF